MTVSGVSGPDGVCVPIDFVSRSLFSSGLNLDAKLGAFSDTDAAVETAGLRFEKCGISGFPMGTRRSEAWSRVTREGFCVPERTGFRMS